MNYASQSTRQYTMQETSYCSSQMALWSLLYALTVFVFKETYNKKEIIKHYFDFQSVYNPHLE
jgi:hypothetical protein